MYALGHTFIGTGDRIGCPGQANFEQYTAAIAIIGGLIGWLSGLKVGAHKEETSNGP